MKILLRYLVFILMVGGACAQGIPQRASTELISDCFLLFSKGTNGNLAYWEISGFRNKAFAIGVPSSGLQACQYQYGGALRYSNDEIKDLALAQCNERMPTRTGCVLYAVNNEIIYDKESHHRQLNQNNTNQKATSQSAIPRRCDPWCWEELDYQKLETATISPISQPLTETNRENKVLPAPVQQVSAVNQTVSTATDPLNISQSDLPACQGSDTARWSNCFGKYTFPDGAKYVGEWKAMLMHGRGTFISAKGVKYEGEWRDNYYNGQGTLFASNGSVISQGVWADGKFVRSASQLESLPSALSNNAEIDRLTAAVEAERKKRQELEAQLAASAQPTPPQTNAPRRIAHALVIGNGAYPGSGRLDNPVNDANAISQKLRSMGFNVTTVTDANRQRLVQSMAQFRRTAASADISLLYYAGHGVQIFGTNYILPTDVDQTDPAQATIQGVSLNSVVENFLPGKTKLVFLDACRDNALQRTSDRSVSKGLAPISVAEGTLISYATKDGQTAADGVGKNSPFTQALLEHINDPQDIAVVLRKVRERVMKITGGKQQPWEYGSLTGGELVLSAIRQK
jgi:hypothetical protein